ncbi:hypothetical protein ACFLXV_04395, partial [Chloroflexota bacterium]
MSKRDLQDLRKLLHPLFALLLVMGLIVPLAGPVGASDGFFELDRNAFDDIPVPVDGDDWDVVVPVNNSSEALASIFIEDGNCSDCTKGTDENYFTEGSKDIDNVGDWDWTPKSRQAKVELTNAYAAAYSEGGNLTLYFGADRCANDGSASMGFWFFQDIISLNANGTFNGDHIVGDLLVQSTFTKGGDLSTIEVYRWVGSGGSEGTIDLIATGADCMGSAGPGNVCATVNQEDAAAPWCYASKSGTAGVFPSGHFFEGYLNVAAISPDYPIVFQSFMATSRASAGVDAMLKDFALRSVTLSAVSIEKTGDSISKAGDTVNYEFTIVNDGWLPLYLEEVMDVGIGWSGLGNLTSLALANGCSELPPGGNCTFTYPYVVQVGDPDPLENTVTATYNGQEDLSGNSISVFDTHSVDLVHPKIEVAKEANTTCADVGDQVEFTITVENLGDVDLILVSADDTITGNLSSNFSPTLPAFVGGNDSYSYTYIVQPGTGPLFNEAELHYRIDGLPNDITDKGNVTVNRPSTAAASNSGPVCQGGNVTLYGDPDGMASYSWTGPSFSASTQDALVSPAVAGIYTLTVIDSNGCTDSANTTVVVYTPPTAIADNSGPVCDGGNVTLLGGPVGMASYSWTGPSSFSENTRDAEVDPAVPGIYT